MPFGSRYRLLVSLRQLGFIVFAVAAETAKPTFTLLATSDALALGDVLPAVWANVLVPEFKEIVPL
jgi:hypothetical protein